jgi:hypothetical protein
MVWLLHVVSFRTAVSAMAWRRGQAFPVYHGLDGLSIGVPATNLTNFSQREFQLCHRLEGSFCGIIISNRPMQAADRGGSDDGGPGHVGQ